MSFFVDANVIVYSVVDGPGRQSCLRVLEAIAAGEARGRTSPAVLEEVWHVVLRHYPGELGGLLESALQIFAPLLPVTEEDLVGALALADSPLDTNDRLHLGTCMTNEIDTILTADRAFDGVGSVKRVDPLDPNAVERLLAAA